MPERNPPPAPDSASRSAAAASLEERAKRLWMEAGSPATGPDAYRGAAEAEQRLEQEKLQTKKNGGENPATRTPD